MTRKDFESVLKMGEHVGVEFKRGGNGAQNDTFEATWDIVGENDEV